MSETDLTHPQEKAVQAAIERTAEEHETPAEVDPHDDRTKENRTPGFSRMRFDWHGQDAQVMSTILQVADDRVLVLFPDAYQILNDLYAIVREPDHDEDGVMLTDRHGWPLWKRSQSGLFIEDWERLGHKDRETFLFRISTRLFDWEQKAADRWTEAMFAKAMWEERFAHAFFENEEGGRKTDEAMTQRARRGSREERYFALFESAISRKADALVRSLERLAQRLKDSLYS